MAMTVVSQPAVANVGTGSGVPKLWSTVISAAEAVASVELDTLLQSTLIQQVDKQWGIFDSSNSPIVTSGRVRAIDMRTEYQVTDAPQENGAFMSYNKVKIPRQIMIEMLCDGTTMSYGNVSAITSLISAFVSGSSSAGSTVKKQFLSLLDSLVANPTLYTVTTPDASYANMNVTGYSIRRSVERGLTMIYAEIVMQEVRLTAKSGSVSSATAAPSGSAQQNGGNVQAQAMTTDQYNSYWGSQLF